MPLTQKTTGGESSDEHDVVAVLKVPENADRGYTTIHNMPINGHGLTAGNLLVHAAIVGVLSNDWPIASDKLKGESEAVHITLADGTKEPHQLVVSEVSPILTDTRDALAALNSDFLIGNLNGLDSQFEIFELDSQLEEFAYSAADEAAQEFYGKYKNIDRNAAPESRVVSMLSTFLIERMKEDKKEDFFLVNKSIDPNEAMNRLKEKYLNAAKKEVREICKKLILTKLIETDSLTQLLSRKAFKIRLNRALALKEKTGVPVVLITFDIDHFKQINDQRGHPEGDEVLRELAARLKARKADRFGRIGGEEFALIVLGTDSEGACKLAYRLLETVNSRKFTINFGTESAEEINVTISIGVTEVFKNDYADYDYSDQRESDEWIFERESDASFDGLLAVKRADESLYFAKESGRNCVVFGAEVIREESDIKEIFPESDSKGLNFREWRETVDAHVLDYD